MITPWQALIVLLFGILIGAVGYWMVQQVREGIAMERRNHEEAAATEQPAWLHTTLTVRDLERLKKPEPPADILKDIMVTDRWGFSPVDHSQSEF